jgi:DNA-binding NarL/FixJ family response regulator
MQTTLQLLMRDGALRVSFQPELTAEQYTEILQAASRAGSKAELTEEINALSRRWAIASQIDSVLDPKSMFQPDQAPVATVIDSLTETQRLICLLSACGVAQKRIALLLDIGLRSVELEKQRVAKHLGLETTQVALWAAANLVALEASLEDSELLTPEISKAICGGSSSLINAGIVKASTN